MATLEEQALNVLNQLDPINERLVEIVKVCRMVLYADQVGEDTFEWTQAQKQALIARYQALKAEIANLFTQLP